MTDVTLLKCRQLENIFRPLRGETQKNKQRITTLAEAYTTI